MNFSRFDLEDLIDNLSDDQKNFSDDTYDFPPDYLEDLIRGLTPQFRGESFDIPF